MCCVYVLIVYYVVFFFYIWNAQLQTEDEFYAALRVFNCPKFLNVSRSKRAMAPKRIERLANPAPKWTANPCVHEVNVVNAAIAKSTSRTRE